MQSGGATVTDTLTVTNARLFEFALSADLIQAGTSGAVTMTVTDSAGRAVFTLSSTAGQPTATTVQFLAAGTYTVRYSFAKVGSAVGPVRFGLFLLELNDGVGPYASGTSTTSTDTGPSGSPDDGSSATYTSSSTPTTAAPPSYGYTF